MGEIKRERIPEKIIMIRVLNNFIAPPQSKGEMTISTTLFLDKLLRVKIF